MNLIENQIVEKIQGEIAKAETAAERNPLINDLSAFLGVVEKRIQLAAPVLDPAAKSIFGTVEAEAGKLVAKVENMV